MASSLNDKKIKQLEIRSKLTISACGSLLTPPLMLSCGLVNPHIGKFLHLLPKISKARYLKVESLPHCIWWFSEDSEIRAVIETPVLGPASFARSWVWQGERGGEDKYRLGQLDKENIREGLRQALRILVAAGAVDVGTHRSDGQRIKCEGLGEEVFDKFLDEVSACGGVRSREEHWNLFISAHQLGSSKMGASEQDGGFVEIGESWEAEGLFVCDGSVLPSALGVSEQEEDKPREVISRWGESRSAPEGKILLSGMAGSFAPRHFFLV
ncbi:hypothetical protein ACLOJK_039811 [Asimina triloba]